MKINRLHQIKLGMDGTILAATLSSSDELILLMSSGSVIRYRISDKNTQYLFSVTSDLTYTDGGFDMNAKSSIYTLDAIVVVVNDYTRHGFIHYPEKYHALHLWRKNYHTDISCYPIALFKNNEGIPHIIYGEAWNHIQIMNLDTRQVVTASKSLIEENAEERHVEFYKKYKEVNKLPWPQPYDYFFGKLLLSPSNRRFLSAGWVWGSFDAYNVYDIEHFISSNRITDLKIGSWEHENRAVCWIDDETIAITYNPFIEGDDDTTVEFSFEIHFYKIVAGRFEIERKIQVGDIDIVHASMIYDARRNFIIAFSNKIGLTIISMDGKIIFQDNNLKIDEYKIKTGTLLRTENNTISVYKMKE